MRIAFAVTTAAAMMLAGSAGAGGGAMMEQRLKEAVAAGKLDGLHSVLVTKDGAVFAEVYFQGRDERWGRDLGVRQHGPDTLHDLRSVTKSVVSLLYGIALAEGAVPPVEAVLVDQFPDYADLAADPARRKITVEDALTMRMGIEWDETLPYSDPRNSEIAMELSADRYRFALDRPIVEAPGERWVYNGGATALIARLIAKGTGQPIDAYAAEKLFAPLGITEWEWVAGADGVPSAASGLRLSTHDLAKIGQMVVDGGKAGGVQVVAQDWLDAALTPRTRSEDVLRYGYFWWLAPGEGRPAWVAGFGNGGQRLSINRELGLVMVLFAGNYNQPDAWRLPRAVSDEYLAPALAAE